MSTPPGGPPGELLGLIVSIGVTVFGVCLILDDVKDYGLFGVERNPPVPHHWIYGVLLMAGGIAGICYFGTILLKKYQALTFSS